MFDIGWTEILVIAVVAIVVFPSKDLPKLLRTVGQTVGKARRMAGDFQSQFNAALREAEREADLMDTKSQIDDLKKLNPLADIKKSLDPIRNPIESIRRELTSPPAPSTAAAAAAGGAAAAAPKGAVAEPNPPAKTGHAADVPGSDAKPAEPVPAPVAVNVPAPAVTPPPVDIAPPPAARAEPAEKKTADGGTP